MLFNQQHLIFSQQKCVICPGRIIQKEAENPWVNPFGKWSTIMVEKVNFLLYACMRVRVISCRKVSGSWWVKLANIHGFYRKLWMSGVDSSCSWVKVHMEFSLPQKSAINPRRAEIWPISMVVWLAIHSITRKWRHEATGIGPRSSWYSIEEGQEPH